LLNSWSSFPAGPRDGNPDGQLREIVTFFALQMRAEPVPAEAAMSERDFCTAALKIPEPRERKAWLDCDRV
jgi:hypothetical protein